MDRLKENVRFAVRSLRRTPSFTVTSLLVLAIGIGMAVAMFTVFNAVLVRRLPVREQSRLVEQFTYRNDPNADYFLANEDVKAVATTSRTLRAIAGVAHWGSNDSPFSDGDRSLLISNAQVTGNFFDVLDVRPMLGRLLKPSDDLPGAPNVVVISYRTWQQQFGGDSAIVGHQLLEPYSRSNYQIVGVAPPGLDYPSGVGLWRMLFKPSDKMLVKAVGRLAPDATPRSAQAEFFNQLKTMHADRGYNGVHVATFEQVVLGDVQPVLVALVIAVLLLLLIACVNVGGLLLVRAAGRARELSIRRALGATSGDLVRMLLIESALLGAVGGALGLIMATLLVKILVLNAPRGLPRLDTISVAGTPAMIAIGVTMFATLVFGVAPAFLAARGHVASTLRLDSRGGTESRMRRNARHALVASQMALALVMLAGAGLLGRTLSQLQKLSLGFEPNNLSLLTVSFPPSESTDSSGEFVLPKVYALGDRLQTAWRAVPGVEAVTPILAPPLIGPNVFVSRVDKEGQSPNEMEANPVFPVEVGGAEYFRAFDTPIKSGRAFTDADNEHAPQVAIVSESVARKLWPNENPIGKRVHCWDADSLAWRTIIGVAGDIHWRTLREASPSIYVPWRQSYWQGAFAVRTSTSLSAVVAALRRATREVNPVLTLWETKPMNVVLAEPLAQPKLSAMLFGGFAMVSMLLAAIGLYGVMASTVRASTREFGVRLALGATPSRLQRRVLRQALVVASVGALVGLGLALASLRLLRALLFEVSPMDPLSLIGSVVLLVSVAMVAAYLPARRATKISPMEALRGE